MADVTGSSPADLVQGLSLEVTSTPNLIVGTSVLVRGQLSFNSLVVIRMSCGRIKEADGYGVHRLHHTHANRSVSMSAADSSVHLPPLPVVDGIEFRHVPGLPGYCASSDGFAWTCIGQKRKGVRWAQTVVIESWTKLKSWPGRGGHLICNVHCNATGKRRTFPVHMLVLLAFHGPKPSHGRFECCHWDDIPTNNVPSNLRWGTRADNHKDAFRNGKRSNRGEKNPRSKLTQSDVDSIRAMYSSGGLSQSEIALMYNVKQTLVSMIVLNKIWKKE
jgi:hypothetical protein